MYITRSRAQVVMEYLVLFVVLTTVTLLSICTLYPRIKQMSEDFFQEAVDKIYETQE